MKDPAGSAGRGKRAKMLARAAAALALLGLPALGSAAHAGLADPLSPGGSALLDGTTYQTPTGTVVAQSTVPFSVQYQPTGTFVDFSGTATGKLSDTVLRDPASGHLTFVYHVSLDNEGITSAAEGSTLTVDGFAGWRTDVAGALQFQQQAPVRRSPDGSMIRFSSGAPGLGGPPELAIATDATHFDTTGTLQYALADEFRVNTPTGVELDTVGSQATIKGVFRPAAGQVGGGTGDPGGTGGPTAVPLPPAFFTGMGVLFACGVITVFRRTLAREEK